MKSSSLVLVDDPVENRFFDLARVLARRGAGTLAAIVLPAPLSDATTAFTVPDGDVIWKACATTAGAPVAMRQYRVGRPGSVAAALPLPLAPAIEELLRVVPPPFAVVAFVSRATLPMLEGLHADARTQPLLKLGVTGAQLDAAFTLAEKLADDRKLHYHEHTLSLERVLGRRLESMIQAHAERAPQGS